MMLDRPKLIKELQLHAHKVFTDYSQEIALARKTWEIIAADPTFKFRAQEANAPWPIPRWNGNLNETIEIQDNEQYSVLAIDGSQIYPDRHQGPFCFLINIGTVFFNYQNPSGVHFTSIPHVFNAEDEQEIEFSV